MKIRMFVAAVALALLAATLPSKAQSVDEIIAKSLAARGGIDKIKAVQSQRLTGRISLGPDAEGPFLVEIKRGGKIREEMMLNGKAIIRTGDGSAGWGVDGNDTPVALSAGEVKTMAGGADIDGPLMDYKAKGNRVEYAGKEKINGKDAYKLTVTLKDGEVRDQYIDCDSNLGIKWSGTVHGDGKEFQVESFFHDYRKVDGVMFAFEIDSDTIGTPYKQRITFEKVEVNPALDDARFGKPAQDGK